MQTLHRLRRFRDLRAVSSGAWPPADGVPVRCAASEWKDALPLPNLPKPTFAVGSRPVVTAALVGTGPESGAVPREHPCQRVIRFRRSRERDRLPDRVCRAALVRQTMAHPGDCPAHHWQHACPPVGVAACLPVRALACLPRWPADSLPDYLSASLPVRQFARTCPSPDR